MSVEALQAGLRAEHAAIFGYGVAGAHLNGQVQSTARQIEMTHRDRRDQVSLLIEAQGGQPAPAEPAYDLPFPVNDASGALRFAAALEEGAAGAWRGALAAT